MPGFSRPALVVLLVLLPTISHGIASEVGSAPVRGAATSLEPCSVLSADEARAFLNGPVKQEVPSPIRYRGVSTGGTCVYRSQKDSNLVLSIRTDATPTAAQHRQFENGRRRVGGKEISGIGDRAYVEARGSGHVVTFLRGQTLGTVTVQGLSVDAARKVAARVAGRVPAALALAQPTPPPSTSVKVGALDPALVGSWFLRQPNGRAVANLHIARDGRFDLTLLAGNRQQVGRAEGTKGVLRLHPERGGRTQEIRYRVLDKNQLEWTDQQGQVTIVRRQFR
jgi:hypothetical protein